ncbi:MAG: hypothetical protein M3P18_05840 [Actinomycetota bacterium]|nr:hypothetical protein [Actinomycetota bacterium]
MSQSVNGARRSAGTLLGAMVFTIMAVLAQMELEQTGISEPKGWGWVSDHADVDGAAVQAQALVRADHAPA